MKILIAIMFSAVVLACQPAYPPCSAADFGLAMCAGDIISICDGEVLSPQIDCSLAGLACLDVGVDTATCVTHGN